MSATLRVYNEPIRVLWAGFESDTLTLQSQGWEISADQDIMRQTMQLAFRLNAGYGKQIMAMTEVALWEYRDPTFYRGAKALRLVHFGPNIVFHNHGPVAPSNWFAVDARPEVAEVKIESLEDFAHFRRPNDIIIPNDCVSDLLERALKVQQPIRDAEMAKRARRNHGSLITLA